MAFIVLSEPAAARLKADPAEGGKIKAAVAKHVADAKTAYKKLAGGVAFVDDIPKNSRCVLLISWLSVHAQ
jgi:4-coumarate--CoA ligase